jgi:hypothetical protein
MVAVIGIPGGRGQCHALGTYRQDAHMDGASHLRRRIAELTNGQPATATVQAHIRGLAEGLIVAGDLTEQESAAILGAVADVAQPGNLHRLDLTTGADISADRRVDMVRAAQSRHPAYTNGHKADLGGEVATLLRVVPLHDVATSNLGQLMLVSLEVWSTSIAIRATYPGNAHSPLDRLNKHVRWEGSDDASTQYREVGSYSSNAHGQLVETRVLQPAPNDTATTLTVHTHLTGREASATLPLR